VSQFISVQERGTIALPASVRKRFHLNVPGAQLEVLEEDGRIVLIPKVPVDAAQAWFWANGWQEGERRASAEAMKGAGKVYENLDDFIADLP
jgi:AbrB family looped-hinge helix DNA binding protein